MAWLSRPAARAALAAGALLLLVLGPPLGPGPARGQAAPQAWTNDQSMFLFYQAFLKIQQEALKQEPGQRIVRQALRRYLEGLDPYSTYLTPQEYQAYKTAAGAQYTGVGMDVYPESPERLVCLPHPESPAQRAGVDSGDLLLRVDGQPVAGLSLVAVGNMVRGPLGSTVALGLRGPQGRERTVRIRRERMLNPAVSASREEGLLLVRIIRFDASTTALLRRALGQARPGDKVVIDLRSCRGGSLYAGVDAAEMLLPPGRAIVTLRRRGDSKRHLSRKQALKLPGPLFLWQDRFTASSAELFIAALVQNQAARSVGTTSFGKATTQKVFPLQDGSALVLTDGKLRGPDGQTWDRRGLAPGLPLAGANPTQDDYLARTAAPGGAVRAASKTKAAPQPAAAPPGPKPAASQSAPKAKLLARVAAPGLASGKRYYICFVDQYDTRDQARQQAARLAAKTPPGWSFAPVPSELASPLAGKFFCCLPPLLTRSQARERKQVLDRKGIEILGIKEGRAPQAAPKAQPPAPNPEDWFIRVNIFSEAANALNDARRLEEGHPVMIAVTIPHAKYREAIEDWLRQNRLAGEIHLCPPAAANCGISYAVLAGPYFTKTEETREDLRRDSIWSKAFWLQRKSLAGRH
ncbi:MAG: PDZ domain-containing protein [Proteobacteria bacterium]|nr:PDZ domain-containing protein [Pseudomonadota bacterium]MBU1449789.1 PDZ domain-containing protein [Pseudomonadota bacterium]MBU2518751.1 PDZ domain-containing protein [Pseudomonadota bacterium]